MTTFSLLFFEFYELPDLDEDDFLSLFSTKQETFW